MDQLNKALDCSSSIFIQACAGAGKTFALTKRYAAVLDDFARKIENGATPALFDQKQILVITFTKKATAEMNERIIGDVNILLSGNEIEELRGQDFCPILRTSRNDKVLSFTKRLKDTFSKNAISTIDSFCVGILREFAFKLNLDPQFLSQDEHDTKRFLNETLDAWVTEKLSSDPAYFHDVLDEFSFYQVKEILKSMYGSREILDEYLEAFENRSDNEIWRDWLTRYTPAGEIENLAVTFKALWKEAQNLCTNKDDALFIGLKELTTAMTVLDNRDPLEYRAFLISDVFRKSIFVTQSGTYIKTNKGQAGNWTDKKEQAMGWFQLLKETVPEEDLIVTPGPQDRKIIPLLKSLITKYRDFDAYFYNMRMDRDLLDFSDVIILTHKLLSEHEDVRRILGKRYRHIMLDEFQDTNPLRWEIIKMILEAGEDIKLFIVGDRKQSIYRFNNADVTVMNAAEDMVRSLAGKVLDFNDNYRSSQALIDEAINPLMRKILKRPDEPKEKYEAVFEDTVSPTNKSGLTGKTFESVWCVHDQEDPDYVPAYHAAYQVKRLLEEHQYTDIDKNENKPLIGVLLRRFTKISDYLQAFHQFNIPVSIFGGKDFYTSTALKDIFQLISVLDNPLDDHALIGLLRSPFFAIPDPLIHRLADRGKRSLIDAMSSIPELQNTYREILTWREQLKTKALDELIAGIIDSEDRELGYVSELMPEQQLANFDKALNIIRGLQRSGSSLREIREYLFYQIRTGADESQAVYPANARVQILTVHKAKGLEFPIVVIPEMNAKGNSDKHKFRYGRSHDKPELSLSLSDDDKPGMLTRLKEIAKQEEEAEEKRVFYVAVTRAAHKVVLLGEGEKALANSWWAKYVPDIPDDAVKDDLLPENWGAGIECLNKETIMSKIENGMTESLSWLKAKQFGEPGVYLYRTPHDLMGGPEDYSFSDSLTGLGTAPGSIFHYCMEKGWLSVDIHEKEIKDHIAETYPNLSLADLWEKITPWLSTINAHAIGSVLRDPGIEKYHELKIKAWLGNEKDTIQVNGTMDLFYKDGEQWTILDYKTDADKRRLSDYRKQLQSYQWMVKQAYGIDADAGIYFVALNEIERIQWDDAYFEQLPFEKTYKPQLPDLKADLSGLLPEIGEGDLLILCASAQHEEQVYLALAEQGRLRPDIDISTLSKFVQECEMQCLSQDKLRLMIRHRNPGMKNGTADLLAKALREEELQKGTIKNEFRSYYKNIPQESGYRSANMPYRHAAAKHPRIILLDVFIATKPEKDMIERLENETDLIRLSLGLDKRTEKLTLLESFSPREEVLACADHIIEHSDKSDQILIAVASMEKYAPHLQRQFPIRGLHARFIGPKALYEIPCTNLLMSYLKLCAKNTSEWQTLAPVLLHPNMKTDDQLFGFDREIRQYPMEERSIPQTGLRFCSRTSDLIQYVSEFINSIKTDNDPDTRRACDKFLDLLEKVMGDLMAIDPRITISDVYSEMSERIKKESIPRRDQWNGIPVVGLLDSLGVQADRLYVLGMVEGDIPRLESDNPFLTKSMDHSLALNRHFMEEWKKRGDRVIFCSSIHAEDGSEQRRSSFLTGMDLIEISGNGHGRRDELLAFGNRKILDHASRTIDRHHEILTNERGIYSGDISKVQAAFDLRVTSVDTLLACPMRYYFDNVMACAPMDQNDILYWAGKKGSVVHKAYEQFVNGNGYALDLDKALALMNDCLDQALTEEKIDRNDPQQMDQFRNYVKNLTAGSDKNCLAINLALIQKSYNAYTRFESEKEFKELRLAHPDLSINLRGRIDKIMFNDNEKKLIASDFKTGSIKTSLLSKMMLSQLYLYLSYCAEAYPGYQLKAMYELLKKPKDTKMVEYTLTDTAFSQGRQSFEIQAFERHLKKLFSQIGAGKYYITEKDFSDACKHCPYDGLCRKDTRLKIKEN